MMAGLSCASEVSANALSCGATESKFNTFRTRPGLPGPLNCEKYQPFGLYLEVLGRYFTYFWGPGSAGLPWMTEACKTMAQNQLNIDQKYTLLSSGLCTYWGCIVVLDGS